jgi:maltooligosyltrehalose trehalohydrolase
VRAATAVLCLAPPLPLLFMGQEWAAPEPFLFFSDLGPDFGPAAAEGRRREFARFPEFADARARERIPSPQALETWERSVLDWSLADLPAHREWLDFHRALLRIRHAEIVPLLEGPVAPRARWTRLGETALEVEWAFPIRRVLRLVANLGPTVVPRGGPPPDWGPSIYTLGLGGGGWVELPPWSVGWFLAESEP